ncbi:hypothetical protein HK097_001544 [Rhizophlyctis rosea]|uniref:CCD97-like C-terminal domain-containing protein n=1 Tax=Rhizophlyctis rosea TaxID=64517 RepID=A0AAD5S4B1_9FUNG|nr:hypothetical protein HK097_001544 [Rhizophlyctis rosea]
MDATKSNELIDTLISLPNFTLRPLHVGQSPPSVAETRESLNRTLQNSPDIFLEKWGKLLSPTQLAYFDAFADRYEVKFHLESLKEVEKPLSKARIRNRRRAYLQQNRGSEYFSDEAYEAREPELYEEYVGQHIPQSERVAPFRDDMGLVDRILYNMDRQRHIDDLEAARRDAEEGYQEFETDDEEEEEKLESGKADESIPTTNGSAMDVDGADQFGGPTASGTDGGNNEDTPDALSVEERDELKAEFRSLMENRFVEGKEKDFDYTTVDNNPVYDASDQANSDIADAYFDSEDPSPARQHEPNDFNSDDLESWMED